MYTLEELKSIVEKYVRDILQQHDLSVARNSTNKKIFNNIVDKCMDDLKNTELRDQLIMIIKLNILSGNQYCI